MIATNNEFWETTVTNVSQNYNSHLQPFCKDVNTLQKALYHDKDINNTIKQAVSKFLYLKGEYLLGITSWGYFTNYRLVYYFNNKLWCIPFYNIEKYELDKSKGLLIHFKYQNQLVEHFLRSWFAGGIVETCIESIKNKVFSNDEKVVLEDEIKVSGHNKINQISLNKAESLNLKYKLIGGAVLTVFLIVIFNLGNNKNETTTNTTIKTSSRYCSICGKVDLNKYGGYECIPLNERSNSYANKRKSSNGTYCIGCTVAYDICK